MYFFRGFILALHIFGVIFWMGGLLMIASLLSRVPEEVGLPKERFLGVARGLFESATNLGAAITIILGLLLIIMNPVVLRQGWLHAKLLLVAILLFYHVRFYRRIIFSREPPEPVVAQGISRNPRNGKRAANRDSGAGSDQAFLETFSSEPSFRIASPVRGEAAPPARVRDHCAARLSGAPHILHSAVSSWA